jgi:hypothetical protein
VVISSFLAAIASLKPVSGSLCAQLIRVAADDLTVSMEVYLALQNGISNSQLQTGVQEKRLFYRKKTIAGINFDKVYQGFH